MKKKNTIKIRNSQNNYGKLYVFNLLYIPVKQHIIAFAMPGSKTI
jgi:hypothetical protein